MKYSEFHAFCIDNGFGAKYFAMRDAVHREVARPNGKVNSYFLSMYLVFYAFCIGARERIAIEIKTLHDLWTQEGVRHTLNDPIYQTQIIIENEYDNIKYVLFDRDTVSAEVFFKDKPPYTFHCFMPDSFRVSNEVMPKNIIKYSGDLIKFLGSQCELSRNEESIKSIKSKIKRNGY